LEPAYNDSQGVTAAFNKNLLTRINQELDGTFDLETWDHHAFYNDSVGRIEMHLMSLCDQIVHIGAKTFVFLTDETIWTECSYKYDLSRFADLAGKSGWRVEHVWTDAENKFSVQFLQPLAHAR
jgi:uncharacterized SAM-dependent methyltransferase